MSNLLPNKTLTLANSLLGVGAAIISCMDDRETVTSLWEKSKTSDQINTYEKFIAGLLLLYSIGAIKMENNILKRGSRANS